MLHEILLSLSGHPSPLLRADAPATASFAGITPPERQLLASAAHLSDTHIKLIASTAQIVADHPSAICRAVAASVESVHLAAWQRKVLQVEEGILKDDPEYVGAYNIVPLTAVMGEFAQWRRRMDWLWELVQFMMKKDKDGRTCHASKVMNMLRRELQSGYRDIEETATSLVAVAEQAWLKQVSAWILYGRLPSFGAQDFFVQKREGLDGEEIFICEPSLLPSFVTAKTASSMLFIGKSLNHVRVKSTIDSGLRGLDHLSSKLLELIALTFPLDSASFSRTITSIRLSLSENTLQKILPLSKVVEMLQLLREFFLLRRGEFAMALTQEADERNRNRWRRADNLAYEKGSGLKNVTVKDGEVAAVLARTWTVLTSMQGQHADEDEQLELARDLLRLHLVKQAPSRPGTPGAGLSSDTAQMLASSPFRDLLFSVPAVLSIQIPSPLDMVLSPSDLNLYSYINSYLMAMRRAHIRLTDLWKITSLRRHHPAPRGAGEYATELRQRWDARMTTMRSSWTTASAAIFFLAETEAYLQTEIVEGLWDGFYAWLTSQTKSEEGPKEPPTRPSTQQSTSQDGVDDDDDIWLNGNDQFAASNQAQPPLSRPSRDPQTLSTAHSLYLRTLVHKLLLTEPTYTSSLYTLLIHIDHLIAHTHRLHSIFTSLDLEADAGVVDAFVDLHAEEAEVTALLRGVERKVKHGVEEVITVLGELVSDPEFAAAWEGETGRGGGDWEEEFGYVPARVGGINRLLMKLDFGGWFGRREDEDEGQ